jgi:putative transposase
LVQEQWSSDITYIRTHEGFVYLAVVIDLFSRRVIGRSMPGRTYTDLPLQALRMAVWRRKPKTKVHVHSDQGSQFTSCEWQEFLEHHNLVSSMSRRGNRWDNAVVESFFNLLKRERIWRKKYKTRKEARQDGFDCIAFFYNPQRKHVRNGMLSPITFEQQQKLKLQGIYKSRGYSIRPAPMSSISLRVSTSRGDGTRPSDISALCNTSTGR